jgi:hypothetical protein
MLKHLQFDSAYPTHQYKGVIQVTQKEIQKSYKAIIDDIKTELDKNNIYTRKIHQEAVYAGPSIDNYIELVMYIRKHYTSWNIDYSIDRIKCIIDITVSKKIKDMLKKNSKRLHKDARNNTKVNSEGHTVISKDDPWFHEDCWDDHFKSIQHD